MVGTHGIFIFYFLEKPSYYFPKKAELDNVLSNSEGWFSSSPTHFLQTLVISSLRYPSFSLVWHESSLTVVGLIGFHPIQDMLVINWLEALLDGSIFWICVLDYLFSTLGCGLALPDLRLQVSGKKTKKQKNTSCSFGFSSLSYLLLRSETLCVEPVLSP